MPCTVSPLRFSVDCGHLKTGDARFTRSSAVPSWQTALLKNERGKGSVPASRKAALKRSGQPVPMGGTASLFCLTNIAGGAAKAEKAKAPRLLLPVDRVYFIPAKSYNSGERRWNLGSLRLRVLPAGGNAISDGEEPWREECLKELMNP